jgi:hypothetical protein
MKPEVEARATATGGVPSKARRPAVLVLGICLAVACLAGLAVQQLARMMQPERVVGLGEAPVLPAIAAAVIFYLLGLVLVARLSDMPNRLAAFTGGFVLRVLVAVVLTSLFLYDDEQGFHVAGLTQAYGLFSWWPGIGYYQLVTLLYVGLGPNILVPKMLNILLGALLPFLVRDLGRWLFRDEATARRGFRFTAYLPPLVVFSTLNLKEVPTAFLLTLVPWWLARPGRSLFWRALGAAVTIAVLYWLRGAPWAVVGALGVLLYLAVGDLPSLRDMIRGRAWVRLALAVALAAGVVSPLFVGPVADMVMSRLAHEEYFLRRFGDSTATVMRFVSPGDALSPTNLAVLFVRGLFSPPPLRFLFDYGIDTLLEAINTAVWYVLMPLALVGGWLARRSGVALVCSAIALAVFALTSMGVAVGSDPYRQRTAMLGLMFLLAARGAEAGVWRRHTLVFALWWASAVVFTVVWLWLRI